MTGPAPYEYNTSWEKIRRVFPSGKGLRILDLGCGDGRLTSRLTGEHEVYGVDSAEEGLKQASGHGIKTECVNLDEAPTLPQGPWDVVLALDILEHLKNLSPLLTHITKELSPDGCIIISLPNHFDLRTRLDILRGKGIIKWSQRQWSKTAWDYEHLRFLTLSDIVNMLAAHGLYPDLLQLNFMSQGLLPTRWVPAFLRRWLVKQWPNAWSGKFVVRARLRESTSVQSILLDITPKNF